MRSLFTAVFVLFVSSAGAVGLYWCDLIRCSLIYEHILVRYHQLGLLKTLKEALKGTDVMDVLM